MTSEACKPQPATASSRIVTFTSSSGTGVQIDYVAGAGAMRSVAESTIVHGKFFRTVDKDDHDPISVAVQLIPRAQTTSVSRRVPTYDRAGLRDPRKLMEVQRGLGQIRPLPADVELTSRCHDLDEQVLGVLQRCCPRSCEKAPRKPWLSDAMFQLVMNKSNGMARARALGRNIAKEKTRTILYALVQRHNPNFNYGSPDGTQPPQIARLCLLRQECETQLMRDGKVCRDAVASDFAAYVKVNEDRLVAAALTGVNVDTFAATKFFRPRTVMPKVLPAANDGTPAGTSRQAAMNIKHYLAELMGGVCDTFADHLGQDRMLQLRFSSELAAVTKDEHAVVGMVDLTRSFAHMKPYKGFGPATVPSELLKHLATYMARLYDSLAVGATLAMSPTLQWRGADVAMIVKRPGASGAVLKNLREIFLPDGVGKAVTGELRARTAGYIGSAVVKSQCGGGLNGKGYDVVHLVLRALCNSAIKAGLCAVAFFTDVQNAFATMCRRHSLELPETEVEVVPWLQLLGLTDDELRDVMAEAARTSEWGETPLHLYHLAAAFHRSLWAAADHDTGVMLPTKGFQAGVPYADIISIIGLSRITRKVATRLRAEGIVRRLPMEGASVFFGVANDGRTDVEVTEQCIVDDVVQPIAVSAEHLENVLSRAAAIVCDAYRCHGLALNFAPTKTAAVVTYAGPGCKDVKERIKTRGYVQVSTHGGTVQLPLVEQYKHVGVQFASGMTLGPDIVRRAAIIKTSAKPLYRKVLTNSRLEVSTRLQLALALTLSKVDHAMGVWTKVSARDFRRFHSAVMYVYRAICGKPRYAKISGATDADVIAEVGAIAPRFLVMIARIMLYARILKACYWPALLAIYHDRDGKESWITVVREDLEWFANASAKLEEFRGVELSGWTNFLMAEGVAAGRLFRFIAVEQTQVVVHQARTAAAIANPGLMGAQMQGQLFGTYVCAVCGAVFAEYQPYAVHLARAHDRRRVARKYALEGNQCTSCLQIFSTRARLIDHLSEKNPICAMTAAWHLQPLTDAEVEALDERGTR